MMQRIGAAGNAKRAAKRSFPFRKDDRSEISGCAMGMAPSTISKIEENRGPPTPFAGTQVKYTGSMCSIMWRNLECFIIGKSYRR